jgi:hypothetical protein
MYYVTVMMQRLLRNSKRVDYCVLGNEPVHVARCVSACVFITLTN